MLDIDGCRIPVNVIAFVSPQIHAVIDIWSRVAVHISVVGIAQRSNIMVRISVLQCVVPY